MDRCPKCGGEMRQTEKDTSSGRDIREYTCGGCGHEVIEHGGDALWKVLSDDREANAAAERRGDVLVEGGLPFRTWESGVMVRAAAYILGVKAVQYGAMFSIVALLPKRAGLMFSSLVEWLLVAILAAIPVRPLLRRAAWARVVAPLAIVAPLAWNWGRYFLRGGNTGMLLRGISVSHLPAVLISSVSTLAGVFVILVVMERSAFEGRGEPLPPLSSVLRVRGSLRAPLAAVMVVFAVASLLYGQISLWSFYLGWR